MPHRRIQVSSWVDRLLFAGSLILLSSAAEAQLVRYVASTGNDANPCTSPSAPCRTLQRGINSAPAGGEVKLLSSVDGDATIDHSLTISGGSFTVAGSIVVNNASATVVLRDLNLFGAGTHDMGVYVTAASSVHIVRCTVERFTEDGILSVAPNSELVVTDSAVRDNAVAGLMVYDESADSNNFGSIKLSVDTSRFENNDGNGLFLVGAAAATISRTVISGNDANGIATNYAAIAITDTIASGSPGAGYALYQSKVTLGSSISRGNGLGMLALTDDDPLVTISNSVFVNNSEKGIFSADAPVLTRGNNTIAGNGIDIDGTLAPLPGT